MTVIYDAECWFQVACEKQQVDKLNAADDNGLKVSETIISM